MRAKAARLDWRERARGRPAGLLHAVLARARDSAARFAKCEARALPRIAGRRRSTPFTSLQKKTATCARRRRAHTAHTDNTNHRELGIALSRLRQLRCAPQAKMKLLTLLFAGAAALAPTPKTHIKATKPAAWPGAPSPRGEPGKMAKSAIARPPRTQGPQDRGAQRRPAPSAAPNTEPGCAG